MRFFAYKQSTVCGFKPIKYSHSNGQFSIAANSLRGKR
jgi:hypothetical protein